MNIKQIAIDCGLLYEYGGMIGANPQPTEKTIESIEAFAKALIGDSEPVYKEGHDVKEFYTEPPSLIAKDAECERYRKALVEIGNVNWHFSMSRKIANEALKG
jgi:hypothetical protein